MGRLSNLEKLKIMIKVSRPLGWIIAPAIFALGILNSGSNFTPLSIVQLFLLSFPACLFVYGINDVFDFRSDSSNPRKKLLEGVKLKPSYRPFIMKAVSFLGIVFVVVSLLTFNIYNILSTLLLLFFGYFYSAPPLRFKERPPLDSFTNGIAYFYLPFLLGFSYGGTVFGISLKYYLVTLCVMGIHSFSTIMDYGADKKAGDVTFAIVFGKRIASLFAFLAFFATLLFAGIGTLAWNFYLIFSSILFMIVFIIPSEKLASWFFKFIFVGFVVAAAVALI